MGTSRQARVVSADAVAAPSASTRADDVDVVVSPRIVLNVLVVLSIGLPLASAAGQLAVHLLPYIPLKARLAYIFFADTEQSVPTAYSILCLLLCVGLLLTIARRTQAASSRDVRHWRVLSLLMLGLAADEYLSLHENDQYLREALGASASGFLYFPWVLAGMAVALVVALAFARFLRRLPRPTRRRFLAAAAVFLAGALGVEMVAAAEAEASGRAGLRYGLITTVEELLEMLGVAVLVHALLSHLDDYLEGFTWRVRSAARLEAR